MIIKYDTDSARAILPISEDYLDFRTYERLNQNLGSTIFEIDHFTKDYAVIDIDYSLFEYDDLNEAHKEATSVVKYLSKYFGITATVDMADFYKQDAEYINEIYMSYKNAYGDDDTLTKKYHNEYLATKKMIDTQVVSVIM